MNAELFSYDHNMQDSPAQQAPILDHDLFKQY